MSFPLQPENEKEVEEIEFLRQEFLDFLTRLDKMQKHIGGWDEERLRTSIDLSSENLIAYIQANYISKDRVREAIRKVRDENGYQDDTEGIYYALDDLKTKLEIE